jgi:ABC-type polysaccharide/polyol phosphate export permease
LEDIVIVEASFYPVFHITVFVGVLDVTFRDLPKLLEV